MVELNGVWSVVVLVCVIVVVELSETLSRMLIWSDNVELLV